MLNRFLTIPTNGLAVSPAFAESIRMFLIRLLGSGGGIFVFAVLTIFFFYGIAYLLSLGIMLFRKWRRPASELLILAEKTLRQVFLLIGTYIGVGQIDAAVGDLDKFLSLDGFNVVRSLLFILTAIILTVFFIRLSKVLLNLYFEKVAHRDERGLFLDFRPVIIRFLNIMIASIASIIVLDHFKIDVKALLVSLGVGSIAIAFAAQETLANIISGFAIMFDRPFRVGDEILLPTSNQNGTVTAIGLRSTKILNFDNNTVVIPNSEISKNQVINFSYPDPNTRITTSFTVPYGSDLAHIRDVLIQICQTEPTLVPTPTSPVVRFTGFTDAGVTVMIFLRITDYNKRLDVADSIRMKINAAFADEQIPFSFPKSVVENIAVQAIQNAAHAKSKSDSVA
jgi:MscS family membrane protein